jgi:uncharacterized protein (TIGR02246 family)
MAPKNHFIPIRSNRMKNHQGICIILGLALLISSTAWADDETPASPEEQALNARGKAMIAAFNRGDANALSQFWSANGDYMDETGRRYQGREAIAKYFQKLFAQGKGAELRIHRSGMRFVRPDLAIGDGIMEVVPPGGGPATSARFTAINVKQDGEWLIESVREAVVTPPLHNEKLDDLAFLIGAWAADNKKGPSANFEFSWTENNRFIKGHLTTTLQDVPVSGATQFIGWDAASKSIRSWVFDSTGSISEATWVLEGNRLVSKTMTTLPDGKRASATNVVTRIDPMQLTWQATNRSLEGKQLPDTELVTLKRVQ